MSNHLDRVSDLAAIKSVGVGAATAGIGFAQMLEYVQNGLATVGSLMGTILVIWTLIEKIKGVRDKSRRKSDKGKE